MPPIFASISFIPTKTTDTYASAVGGRWQAIHLCNFPELFSIIDMTAQPFMMAPKSQWLGIRCQHDYQIDNFLAGIIISRPS